MKGYQFRYRAYAAAHGLSPKAMFRHDRKRRPEAPGLGFVYWMGEQWRAFDQSRGFAQRERTKEDTNAAFDTWLRSWCFARRAGTERAA